MPTFLNVGIPDVGPKLLDAFYPITGTSFLERVDLTSRPKLLPATTLQGGQAMRWGAIALADSTILEPVMAVPPTFVNPFSRNQYVEQFHKILWLSRKVCADYSHNRWEMKLADAFHPQTVAMRTATDPSLELGLGNGYWICHCAAMETMTMAGMALVSGTLCSMMGLPLDRILHVPVSRE